MEAKRIFLTGLLVAAGLVLLVGCSEVGPTDPGVSPPLQENSLPVNNLTPYSYPAAANIPPPGYQFLHPAPSPTPTTDDDYATMMINQSKGGTLWLNQSCITIYPWAIDHSQWISMAQTMPNELVIDFETHGLVFDGPQYCRISYAGWQIPPGLTPADLVVWYWNNEQGVYEYIGGNNVIAEQYIEFDIFHFSRYVVAGPIP